jgi:inward rectifier potassium channel
MKKLKVYDDTGFGTRVSDQGARLINPNGTFNVTKKGVSIWERISFYHTLITMPWWQFHLMVVGTFIVINTIFAFLYMLAGPKFMYGSQGTTWWDYYWEAFFFSAQTITTVGYGRVSPFGIWTNILASIESLAGLMGFALITGMLYGRFARPVTKLLFSENMLLAPFNGGTGLMLRVANPKLDLLIDMECTLMLSWVERTEIDTEQVSNPTSSKPQIREIRRYYELPLERKYINFLALSWTIVHPIIPESPLFGVTEAKFLNSDAEFIAKFKGYDETFNQNVSTQYSYKASQVTWGARFKPMYYRSETGSHTVLDLEKISLSEPAILPSPAAIPIMPDVLHATADAGINS